MPFNICRCTVSDAESAASLRARWRPHSISGRWRSASQWPPGAAAIGGRPVAAACSGRGRVWPGATLRHLQLTQCERFSPWYCAPPASFYRGRGQEQRPTIMPTKTLLAFDGSVGPQAPFRPRPESARLMRPRQ